MEQAISIRHATPDDAELLSILGARAFTAAYEAKVDPVALAWYVEHAFNPERQADELADEGSLFLIAEADGREIGFARLREGSDTPAAGARRPIELARLYVTPSWIGRGAGSALMEAALAEANRRECDAIWLGVWTENPGAIAFYERWGFREIGRQPFTMGGELHHDLLMSRAVIDPSAGTMRP
jgi:GNAT superfamily N-acetyltransferase